LQLFEFTINGTMSTDDNESVNCFTLDRELLPELSLGADKVVSAVQERIERHFKKLDRGEYEEPLVVGILGEWGSGKTLWLKSIENAFAEQLESDVRSAIDNDSWPNSITVPVFFNAWRYEKEEHLIYPLIKVLERRIGNLYKETKYCHEKYHQIHLNTPQNWWRAVRAIFKTQISNSSAVQAAETMWGTARRLLAAIGAGIVTLGSGVTISGKLHVSDPVLTKLFGAELGVEVSGKSITDLLVILPEKMRNESEAGRASATKTGGDGKNRGKSTPQNITPVTHPEDLIELAERAHSDYYDFHSVLRDLTGRKAGAEDPKINLLFFIDDLDRCLPEKAVEMLEAIKLFLEVEGTAFVLALDDEVVERGIAHRYRDYADAKHPTAWDSIAYSLKPERYREFLGLYADNREEPITGHEYMEKIVHLQVRIPRVQEVDAKTYLLEKYPNIFGAQSMGREKEHADTGRAGGAFEGPEKKLEEQAGDEAKPGEGEKGRPRPGKDAGGQSVRTQLLELFATAVPPVPRKLIRAAELLSLKIEAARKNGWDPAADESELYILAQLTIVQLFAPELYRFALKNGFFTFLQRLESWLEEGAGGRYPPSNHCLEELERAYRERLTERNGESAGNSKEAMGDKQGLDSGSSCSQKPAELNSRVIERLELPLVDLVIRSRRQRSGFDPFGVVATNPDGLYDDLQLAKFFMLRLPVEEGARLEQVGFEDVRELPAIVPKDPQIFVDQITSNEPTYWLNALQDQGVQGKRGQLAGEVFEEILERLKKKRPDGMSKLSDPDLLIRWLELLEPLLSAEQLDELVAKTQAFSRILKEEARG